SSAVLPPPACGVCTAQFSCPPLFGLCNGHLSLQSPIGEGGGFGGVRVYGPPLGCMQHAGLARFYGGCPLSAVCQASGRCLSSKCCGWSFLRFSARGSPFGGRRRSAAAAEGRAKPAGAQT